MIRPKTVRFTLKTDRVALLGGVELRLPANTTLTGRLGLEASDGPLGIREYDHPSFVSTCFDFEYLGRRIRHTGLLCQFHLWAPNGTQTTSEDPGFISECGVIDGMMDAREDWHYIRPDGTRHTNRLKQTSCQFELMVKENAVLVRCRYYDQNPGVAGYLKIHYARDLDDLLLLKDMKFYCDQSGKVEDWAWNEGSHVTLVEPYDGGQPSIGWAVSPDGS